MFANKSLLLFLSICLASCSTQTSFKFLSTPNDADVVLIDANGFETNLGKTPLSTPDTDVFKNNKFSQIKFKKTGYNDQNILLVKSFISAESTINVQLKKDENQQNIGEQTINQEKIASAVARANGLIQSKQYVEAETVMSSFVDQYPSVSVGYDYLGNINYLLKKYAKALKYYNKAASLNPQNPERKIVIEKISNLVKSQSGDAQ